jgi:sRNA-binding carbon storage regulator CsrA
MLSVWRQSRRDRNRIVVIPPSGGKIAVTVVAVVDGRVKVAVDVPTDWQIEREEVYLAKVRDGEITPR